MASSIGVAALDGLFRGRGNNCTPEIEQTIGVHRLVRRPMRPLGLSDRIAEAVWEDREIGGLGGIDTGFGID
jgi:hypothetical protein